MYNVHTKFKENISTKQNNTSFYFVSSRLKLLEQTFLRQQKQIIEFLQYLKFVVQFKFNRTNVH